MRVVTLDAKRLPKSAGIGGRGKVTRVVFVPVCFGGRSCVIEFLVLGQDIPPWLPIGLCEK